MILIILPSTLLISACGNNNTHKTKDQKSLATKTLTIKLQSRQRKLFYNGILYPLNAVSVLSPYDGNISTIHFNYGTRIKKGQLLFTITSNEIREEYKTKINEYFKAKDSYTTEKATQEGNEILFKNGLTPENDYRSSLSTFHNTKLSYYQAKTDLDQVLKRVNLDPKKFDDLSLANTKKINELLGKQFDQLKIYSPANGIALFPIQSSQIILDDNENKKLQPGSAIKNNQLILSIGELNGLRSDIVVNEININQIKTGETAVVSSPAFPGIVLQGAIDNVAAQANAGTGDNSQSVFNVSIKIPNVPKQAWDKIRIGMSAKITIKIPYDNKIFIPINAITMTNGQAYVMRLETNGDFKKTPVTTGYTTQSEIQVLSGLNVGDKIQYTKTSRP